MRSFVFIIVWFLSEHAQAADAEHFEKVIRPLLAKHCFECHSVNKQFQGLRLDSKYHAFQGGDSGAAIIPGKPHDSLLFNAVNQSGELRMPPDGKLSAVEIAAIQAWIETGAVWPDDPQSMEPSDREKSWEHHWSFQPIRQSRIPSDVDPVRCNNAIDNFVWSRLEAASLKPLARADRRTLIRRVTYDLTGLPPSLEDVNAFDSDTSPLAYERLIDRLLASPTYGEHFARTWLDIARYSDTKGYVYAREERFFVNAAAYREWIVRAFQTDLPFDRFLLLQIAADRISPDDPTQLAAMGFLTLGRRFLGVTHDIIDDRIDVVSRGTMGLTVSCARCHDHKYDPIPTSDYYSLYGIFQNCSEKQVSFATIKPEQLVGITFDEYEKGLRERLEKLQSKLKSSREEISARTRARFADYLLAQSELHRYPEEGFDTVLTSGDLNPTVVRRFENYLADAKKTGCSIFNVWFQFAALDPAEFSARAKAISADFASTNSTYRTHALVAKTFAEPPHNLRDVANKYAELFRFAETQIKPLRDRGEGGNEELSPLFNVLYGRQSPCEVPDEEIVSNEFFFDSGTVVELWKLQSEVDRWRLKHCLQPNIAVAVVDRENFVEPRVFRRGNAAQKGDYVKRHFLSRFSSVDTKTYETGSGRLELAKAITNPNNPLTARVWVNRLWQHHFGIGLVPTASDFGLRAPEPSHPELLDWLASQLITNGWSTQSIHRTILLSATYQRASFAQNDDYTLVDSHVQHAMQIDPGNRLLWRVTPRKLTFEEMRDTLLSVSGDLDLVPLGKTSDMFASDDSHHRRTIYGLVDRQFLAGTLRHFDFANPDLHIAKRSETSIPQQSLFMLNSPFIASRARSLAKQILASRPEATRFELVDVAFEHVFRRKPSAQEKQRFSEFLTSTDVTESTTFSRYAADWSYGYGEVSEHSGKLSSFHALPHFTKGAWQGSDRFPDSKLGWVQLTAGGGHPGNDLQHACVRRWTAPSDMSIRIRSTAKHEPQVGDGIRCRIVSSIQGTLESKQLRGNEAKLDIDRLSVKKGETIDFVVDILRELNSDQFLWCPKLHSDEDSWDATRDFSGPMEKHLTPLEMMAQALMLSNELMFVD